MATSTSERADQALQELLEVSPKVEAAIVLRRDGTPLAARCGGADGGAADTALSSELARLATTLFEQAERSRTELGREAVVQLEVATGNAHVFLVGDAQHAALAVTELEPTVGLVFYDLKTVLRSLRDTTPGDSKPDVGDRPKRRSKSAGNGARPARDEQPEVQS